MLEFCHNLYVKITKLLETHLVGSVYLISGPSSILDIVFLHLGTDFRTGSNVTCRLKKKTENTRKRSKKENSRKCILISEVC